MPEHESQLESLARRVAILERQNRRFRRIGASAVVALGALILMAQTAPRSRIVEAQGFILKDVYGVKRGGFELTPDGSSLTMFGKDGKLIWSAPPLLPAGANAEARPRVFVDVWDSSIGFEPEREKDPSWLMEDFALGCPAAVATLDEKGADYLLRITIMPMPKALDAIFSAFDSNRDMVASDNVFRGNGPATTTSKACHAILADWAAKGHKLPAQ